MVMTGLSGHGVADAAFAAGATVGMEPSSGNRIELRRHRRYVVSGTCLLSFSQFTLSISFAGDPEGEGMVVNLSPQGCMVESEAAVKVAEAMSLIILLPDQQPPTPVDLAVVRWAQGDAFGLEFISMGTKEAARILEFLGSMDKGADSRS
jgi:hypothetical protein